MLSCSIGKKKEKAKASAFTRLLWKRFLLSVLAKYACQWRSRWKPEDRFIYQHQHQHFFSGQRIKMRFICLKVAAVKAARPVVLHGFVGFEMNWPLSPSFRVVQSAPVSLAEQMCFQTFRAICHSCTEKKKSLFEMSFPTVAFFWFFLCLSIKSFKCTNGKRTTKASEWSSDFFFCWKVGPQATLDFRCAIPGPPARQEVVWLRWCLYWF